MDGPLKTRPVRRAAPGERKEGVPSPPGPARLEPAELEAALGRGGLRRAWEVGLLVWLVGIGIASLVVGLERWPSPMERWAALAGGMGAALVVGLALGGLWAGAAYLNARLALRRAPGWLWPWLTQGDPILAAVPTPTGWFVVSEREALHLHAGTLDVQRLGTLRALTEASQGSLGLVDHPLLVVLVRPILPQACLQLVDGDGHVWRVRVAPPELIEPVLDWLERSGVPVAR